MARIEKRYPGRKVFAEDKADIMGGGIKNGQITTLRFSVGDLNVILTREEFDNMARFVYCNHTSVFKMSVETLISQREREIEATK